MVWWGWRRVVGKSVSGGREGGGWGERSHGKLILKP